MDLMQLALMKKMGGGGGASSWNDLTDRPFGEEVAIIVDETVECDSAGEGFLNTVPILVEGNTYTVVWDGASYSCVAFSEYGAICLGGPGGEPFTVMVADGMAMVFAQEGTHTITISGISIKQIDSKFIPTAPFFNLSAMGLGTVGEDEVTLECDTSEMRKAFERGAVYLYLGMTVKDTSSHRSDVVGKIFVYPIQGANLNHFWFCMTITPYSTLSFDVTDTAIKAKIVNSV